MVKLGQACPNLYHLQLLKQYFYQQYIQEESMDHFSFDRILENKNKHFVFGSVQSCIKVYASLC